MKFTKHALFRMEQRGIDKNSIESAINDPDETIDSFGRRKLARKIIDNKTLEIVYIEEDDIISNNCLLVRGNMNISYDKDADCLYIQFQQGKVNKTKKIDEGILVDLDETGRIFGIEIVGVSERMSVASLGKINIDIPIAEVIA